MASDAPNKKANKTLSKGIESLLDSGDYSDFTIVCQGREFKVHKSVICSQSMYFRAACGGSFKESKERRLELNDIDSEIVEAILQYLYTEQYTCQPENKRYLHFHARVFLTAKMLMLDQLQYEAIANFQNVFLSGWIFSDLINTIDMVYGVEEKEPILSEQILMAILRFRSDIFGQGTGANQMFMPCLKSTPELGADLAEYFSRCIGPEITSNKDQAESCSGCDRKTLEELCSACTYLRASKESAEK